MLEATCPPAAGWRSQLLWCDGVGACMRLSVDVMGTAASRNASAMGKNASKEAGPDAQRAGAAMRARPQRAPNVDTTRTTGVHDDGVNAVCFGSDPWTVVSAGQEQVRLLPMPACCRRRARLRWRAAKRARWQG